MRLAIVNLITRTPTRRKVPPITSNSDAMIVKLCRELRALDHEVDLYVSDLYEPSESEDLGVNVIYLSTFMRGLPELPFTPGLMQCLRGGYDVVLLSEAFQWSTVFAVLARVLSVGVTPRLYVWQELSVHQRTFRELPSRIFYRLVLKHGLDRFITGYIPRGERAGRFLVDNGVKRSRLLASVPHGVDHHVLFPDDRVVRGNYLFAPARLVDEKGVDVLLHALRKILDAGGNCRLVVQGDGPEADRFLLLASELHLQDHVEFARARVSHERMRELFSGALMTLVASRRDFMLFSVMESLACGTPVVVSDAVDISDEVASQGGGRVFRCNEADELAATVIELLSAPDQLDRLRRDARAVGVGYRNDSVARALISRFEFTGLQLS